MPGCAHPGGRTTTHRLGRPSFVTAGESSIRSKPSASRKKLIAGSSSLTTMAIRRTLMSRAPGRRIPLGG
jgi:hypothetical protein